MHVNSKFELCIEMNY